MEANEILRFYKSLQVDIRFKQLSGEDGGTLEQLFTAEAIALLADAGETEDARVVYHESVQPRHRHKINAFSIHGNYETLDLFVTTFKSTEEISRIQKSEIMDAAKLAANFYYKATQAGFVGDLEESSEIFDFARTLECSADLKNNLVRINITILTDGTYTGEIPADTELNGIPIFYKVADITWLYNLSEKTHSPIEIDFIAAGYIIPCIEALPANGKYQSYLAIIPGRALAEIYERYGARLLEQNVRAFLQFTGKINKGIRETIKEAPEMFLAYNNGLAATAESVEVVQTQAGLHIGKVNDLQIVNGGQTTASIYHTWKKDRADISKIFVPVKLSLIKEKENFGVIVSRISEYANTQNKVSVSDLSSNKPFHIRLEKLSRDTWAPAKAGKPLQSRWFYERARGQYRNLRQKEGTTKHKVRLFDSQNPASQVFTKEDLAKYVNACAEVYDDGNLVIGPHIVVRGSQKNYAHFIKYNIREDPDVLYFEEVVSKAILFRSAERIYGIKPNAIGDMRYITVPYSIAWLCQQMGGGPDYGKIWKNQSIPGSLESLLYELMVNIENFIKRFAPGSLYGEWAKKVDCWLEVKNKTFDVDLSGVVDYAQ
jgi:hypothetical protein